MIAKKVFSFIFKGHEYTPRERAIHPGHCPHCDLKSPWLIWEETDKGFIGCKKIDPFQYIYCFECPKCFEKFFFHSPIRTEMRKLYGYPPDVHGEIQNGGRLK